jgi:CheY-like chemotaxis protein
MDISTSPYALVVDDDAIILMHACDILESAGFRCYEASAGDEAIKLLEDWASSVTLLFSDVEMPGQTNGFGLARHVARHWPWIEIVIASGHIKPGQTTCPPRPHLSASRSITRWFTTTCEPHFQTRSSPNRSSMRSDLWLPPCATTVTRLSRDIVAGEGLMGQTNTVARAFELAKSGSCRTVDDIRQQLKREGYANCAAHLSGASIRKQLLALLNQSQAAAG